MYKLPFFVGLFLTFFSTTYAQLVTTDPVFPTSDEPVTLIFDASEGTGGLAGLPMGEKVYAHLGLIVEGGSPGVWQYIVGNWGTDDSRVEMTRQGTTDIYTLTLEPNIREWYEVNNNGGQAIPQSVNLLEMAMVFRNVDGSKEGKADGNQDIFVPLFEGNARFVRFFQSPGDQILSPGETLNVLGVASEEGNLTLFDNGNLVASVANDDSLSWSFTATAPGDRELVMEAVLTDTTIYDTFRMTVQGAIPTANPPAGTRLGITAQGDTGVLLALYAPGKDFVYVVGDFNQWAPSEDYLLVRGEAGTPWEGWFWLSVDGLSPDTWYRFQYWVDEEIRTADPYSELVLDPIGDNFIPEATWPNLPGYPFGKGEGIVSLFQLDASPYVWQVDNFQRPPREELVVYELLVRDFISAQNFQTLIDTLDYLQNLGINAIELMPVSEFDGNNSWGYNPTFHMALDKYYGTPDAFKAFVDACHQRGIAVILDVVYNHAHERSPFAKLYWDAANFRPAADNPWLNQQARHPFNVFFDFNHEREATQYWVHALNRYWLEEYRVDGYRFDLSKGFTQKFTTDVGAWSQYDADRVALLKEYADSIWALSPDFYVILEHFADNTEEKELADYGMLFWGNHNYNYNQATMGYGDSDFSWISWQERGWDAPNLIGYMESHDEERLMYKNLEFGNENGSYSVKELSTALQRQELGFNFFLTIPGPKMIWQFGELGYDYSIFTCFDGTVDEGNDFCKLEPKPIRWDYFQDSRRERLYQVFRELMRLRNTYEVFHTDDFDLLVNQSAWKRIQLNDPEMNVTVLGNFNILPNANIDPNFQHTGWWYEFYTGDSLLVDDVNAPLNLAPGEYRLYTDQNIGKASVITQVHPLPSFLKDARLYPNPSRQEARLELDVERSGDLQVEVLDSRGQVVGVIYRGKVSKGSLHLMPGEKIQDVPSGLYYLAIRQNGQVVSLPWIIP